VIITGTGSTNFLLTLHGKAVVLPGIYVDDSTWPSPECRQGACISSTEVDYYEPYRLKDKSRSNREARRIKRIRRYMGPSDLRTASITYALEAKHWCLEDRPYPMVATREPTQLPRRVHNQRTPTVRCSIVGCRNHRPAHTLG
jgi:hypothetical protein